MTHVHHDLASVFQVVHVVRKLCQVRVGQIKRNADDGLTRRTSPFIGEITKRTELVDALGFQFAIKLLNESFEWRTLKFEPEFANGLGEYLLEFRSSFLEITHWAIQSSIPRNRLWHGRRIAYAHSIVGTHGSGTANLTTPWTPQACWLGRVESRRNPADVTIQRGGVVGISRAAQVVNGHGRQGTWGSKGANLGLALTGRQCQRPAASAGRIVRHSISSPFQALNELSWD